MKSILLILAVVAVAAFGFFSFKGKSEPLRIGMNAWPGYEYLYLAKQKGFYKAEGVDVEIIQYDSLEDVRFGYEQGQIDIMASTIIELLLTADRGGQFPQAFLIPDFSNGADVVVGTSDLKDITDLKSKNIAVEPESLGLFMLVRTLSNAGIDIADVNVVGMSQQNMHRAMVDGEIDAAVTYPPVSVKLLNGLKGSSILFDSSQIPGEIIDTIVSDKILIKSRLGDFKAIVRAWDNVKRYAEENENEALTLMAKREQISKAEFKDVLLGMKILDSEEQLQYIEVKKSVQRALKSAEEALFKHGYLKNRIDTNALLNVNPLRK